MKTKFIALCGVLLAFTLTACSNGNSSLSSGKAGNSSQNSSTVVSSSRASSSSKSSTSTSQVHVHSFVAGTKTGAFTPEECSCGLKAYRFDIADAAGWNNPDSKMNGKVAPDNASTWSLAGLPVGNYRVDVNAQLTSSSHTDRHWYNMAIKGDETATNSPDTIEQAPFRYWVELDTEVVNPNEEGAFGAIGLSADGAATVSFVSTLEVKTGTQNLVFKHGDIGYSIIVKYLRFVAK